ncbi:hypothetical protein BaRGS_00035068, partial [Batillaria attramentaria]
MPSAEPKAQFYQIFQTEGMTEKKMCPDAENLWTLVEAAAHPADLALVNLVSQRSRRR